MEDMEAPRVVRLGGTGAVWQGEHQPRGQHHHRQQHRQPTPPPARTPDTVVPACGHLGGSLRAVELSGNKGRGQTRREAKQNAQPTQTALANRECSTNPNLRREVLTPLAFGGILSTQRGAGEQRQASEPEAPQHTTAEQSPESTRNTEQPGAHSTASPARSPPTGPAPQKPKDPQAQRLQQRQRPLPQPTPDPDPERHALTPPTIIHTRQPPPRTTPSAESRAYPGPKP